MDKKDKGPTDRELKEIEKEPIENLDNINEYIEDERHLDEASSGLDEENFEEYYDTEDED